MVSLINNKKIELLSFCLLTTLATQSIAEEVKRTKINLLGSPGIIDMPSAEPLADGEIALSAVRFGGTLRTGLTFQITPRISGGFRYVIIKNFDRNGTGNRYDRSFDVAYQLAFEGKYRPAIRVGLQDFGGTGIYSGEYLAFTKTLGSSVQATAGIGWGRFGGRNSFSNPLGALSGRFRDRPADNFNVETAGSLNFGNWFRGDAALFAGAVWQTPMRGLTAKVEYSSDTHQAESARGVIDQKSPLNFGLEYAFRNGANLGLYSLYGSEIALKFSTSINPKRPLSPSVEPAPIAVRVRADAPTTQSNIFGRVIDSTKTRGGYSGDLPDVETTRTETGVLIGTVKAPCNAAIARELDAEYGKFDLVIFTNGNAQPVCTVALRPVALSHIENLNNRATYVTYNNPESLPDTDSTQSELASLLESQFLALEYLSYSAREARVGIRNPTFGASAQAIGRAARALTVAMPKSVETFIINVVERGVSINQVTLKRSDLEQLEFHPDNAWASYIRAEIRSSDPNQPKPVSGLYPKFFGSIAPYTEANLFDPDNPLRVDAGLQFSGIYDIAPGFSIFGHARSKLFGNINEVTRGSNSLLPRVRTDINKYQLNQGAVRLDRLTADYFFRATPNIYGHVQAGILERMYAGVAGELLWKPVNNNLAFGVEVAHVKQRDFDGLLGLRDFTTTTGHASAYYTMPNGFKAQVDVGKYLAGDIGATFSVDRTFKNGWEVGAFATKTNVSSDEFGEGSFDKGIRFRVPLSWLNGKPNRNSYVVGIQPVQRDGGARLNLGGRIHPIVSSSDRRALTQSWGKFWR